LREGVALADKGGSRLCQGDGVLAAGVRDDSHGHQAAGGMVDLAVHAAPKSVLPGSGGDVLPGRGLVCYAVPQAWTMRGIPTSVEGSWANACMPSVIASIPDQ
jgi:hypothetical protein